MVAGGAGGDAAQSRAILENYRVGLNSSSNGVWLPNVSKGALNPEGVLPHEMTFSNAYNARVYRLLSGATSQADVLNALDYIQGRLSSGLMP